MSTVTVKYLLSAEARRRLAVETGDEPKAEQELVVDLTPLTPEQRAVLLDTRDKFSLMTITLQKYAPLSYPASDRDPWYTTSKSFDDFLRSADDVLAALIETTSEQQQAQAEQVRLRAEANAKATQSARAYLASDIATNQPGNLVDRPGLWSEAEGYDEASALVEQVKAEYTRRTQLTREREAQKSVQAQAQRERDAAARLAWAREHGSEQLRRGLEAGHSCARLYVVERQAAEFPGYTVDYNDVAGWKSRSTPSLAALDERDAVLAVHPDLDSENVEIVWLTDAASNAIPDSRDDADDDDAAAEAFEPREAVVVRGWMDKYDLVREI